MVKVHPSIGAAALRTALVVAGKTVLSLKYFFDAAFSVTTHVQPYRMQRNEKDFRFLCHRTLAQIFFI